MAIFKSSSPFIILLSCIIGFIYWESVKKSYWKFFPLYLLIVTTSEIARYLPIYGFKIESLHFLLINIIPIEFLFFFWLFYKNSQKKSHLFIGSAVYLIAFLIENIWADTMKSNYFSSFSYSIGNIILLFFILEYFYRLMNSDRILNFKKERMFWVALGLLVFFLGTFPYFGLYNLMLSKYFSLLVSYTWVEIFLNYAMYLLFAASFIWGKEN